MSHKRALSQFDNSKYLCSGDDDKRFGRIYEGLLRNAKWAALSPQTKLMYIICIAHVGTTANYRTLKWYREHEQIPESMYADGSFFMLSREQLRGYGINTHRYSDRFSELCRAGFLEIIHRNAHRKMPNLYRLNDEWKRSE